MKPPYLEFTSIAGEDAIVLGRDFMSKNNRSGLLGSIAETARAITVAEQTALFRRYLSKLNPLQDRLFQRACYDITVLKKTEKPWFMNAALGHNKLTKFIRELSIAADLSTQ